MRPPHAHSLWYSWPTSEPIAPQIVARPIRYAPAPTRAPPRPERGAADDHRHTRRLLPVPHRRYQHSADRSGHDGRRRRGAPGAQRRLGQCHARRAQQAHGAAHARLLRRRRSLGRGEHGGQGTCAGFAAGGRGVERGCLHHSPPHAPVPRRARRYRAQWRAAHPRQGDHAAQRPGRRACLPTDDLRRPLLHRADGGCLDGAGRYEEKPAREPGELYRTPHAGKVALVLGAGNRLQYRPARHLLQALQRGSGRRLQDEPRQRLPWPAHGGRLPRADRRRLPAHRLRRSRGGRISLQPFGCGRDPYYRVGQDLRRHRLGSGRRGCGA